MAKYGIGTLTITVLFGIAVIILGAFINSSFVKYPLIIAGSLLILFAVYFFRDPERVTPENEKAVISPADGTVLAISEVEEPRFIKGKAKKISIFMSPFNVHVNRIPVTGTIGYLNYIKGEYLVAYYEKADERNERNEIGVEGKYGKIFYVQIAGLVARRIECELEKGQSVKAGERFGMIKFGSRVDVYAPVDFDVKVAKDEKVTAGETILFEINK